MSVLKAVVIAGLFVSAGEQFAFANGGVGFPASLVLGPVVIGLPYLLLYFLVHSLRRTYKERKDARLKPLINLNMIALAAPLLALVIVPVAIGGWEGMAALWSVAVVVILFGGAMHFPLRRLRLAVKDGKGEGWRPGIVGRTAGWTLGFLTVLFIMSLAAYSPPANYRDRARNAAAQADLRNARVTLEAYYVDNKETYPKSLNKTNFQSSPNVLVIYRKVTGKKYSLTSSHREGDKEYMCSSDDSAIYWRYKKDPNAKWQPI